MKCVHVDNYCLDEIFGDEISEILGRDDFNVELFEVDINDDTLPLNFQIIDYYSRETLAIIDDGEVIDDQHGIALWLEENVYSD